MANRGHFLHHLQRVTVVICFWLTASSARAAIIPVASCSHLEIQAALDAAQDGDIVQVPPGICSWTQTVKIGSSVWDGQKTIVTGKSVTLQGAGIDQTILYDDVPTVNTRAPMLMVYMPNDEYVRVTGFTFRTGPTVTQKYSGAVTLTGRSKNFRVDHNKFEITALSGTAVTTDGWLYGVIDHNIFEKTVRQAIRVYHTGWEGKSFGDGSFSSPSTLGSEKAVYLEDNIIRCSVATDAYAGARYVVRHNLLETTGIPVQNHGTDSTGRARGAFSWEVYRNTATMSSSNPLFHMRSGIGVIFDNHVTGAHYLTNLGTLNNYRNSTGFNPYGPCDGSGPFDKNDGVVYESGTQAAGVTSTNETLTADGKNWTPNQWTGYSIRNLTKGWGSEIFENTANTISAKRPTTGTSRIWEPGDQFQVLRVQACLDQVGRSTGDLITGGEYAPSPIGWPNQKLEPVYLWGNTLNDIPNNEAASTTYVIKKDREFFSGVRHPTYVPYPYPHSLITTGKTLPPPITAPAGGSSPVSFAAFKTVFFPAKDEKFNVRYTLTAPHHISLKVIDRLGREIAVLEEGDRIGPERVVAWNGRNAQGEIVSSGIYLLLLKYGAESLTKKIVVVK